jgi:hypothetical protein
VSQHGEPFGGPEKTGGVSDEPGELGSSAGEPTKGRFGRRQFLQLGGTAGAAALAVRTLWPTQAGASAIGLPSLQNADPASASGAASNVAELTTSTSSPGIVIVPAPTGTASTDTANALAALNSPAGTTVVFQASSTGVVYSIDQELPVPAGVRVTGYGAACEPPQLTLMPTLQQAQGSSLTCIMASAAYLAGLYNSPQYNNGVQVTTPDSAIEIDHLTFDGQNSPTTGTANTVGHGLVLFSSGSAVHDCYFYSTAQASLVVADSNYAGGQATTMTSDNRLYDNKIMNAGWEGLWVIRTNGAPGSIGGYMLNNIVQSPSLEALGSPNINPATGVPYEAIRMDLAAGWWVVNNHAYACPGHGMYFGTPWGSWITGNAIDSFGCIPVAGATYTGYYIVLTGAANQNKPVLVNQNQLSACEGYDLYSPVAPGASNTYQYYVVEMEQASSNNSSWFEQSGNSAHQNSQPPTSIGPASLTAGSTTVTVPNGSTTHNVQAGMNISDSSGLIPSGTTVIKATAGSGTNPDTITFSAAATGTSSGDTLNFTGPTSVAWTYINDVSGSTLVVNRTNEVISGTVNPTPAISGAGTVQINDPAALAAGLKVHGTPSPNHVLVAESAKTARWMSLKGNNPGPVVSVVNSSGSYSIPSGASHLRITCVGGGGGGGGGGSASSVITQAGGSGGAAGTTSSQLVAVGSNTSLTVTIGTGGHGGAGGAAGGKPGSNGSPGADTTVTGTGISVRGAGGPGGPGSPRSSTSGVAGSAYGGKPGDTASGITAGCGGGSGSGGGSPLEYSPGGGGGGASSSSRAGGAGGQAGSSSHGGRAGTAGASATSSGKAGGHASSPGAGGGGGGGGTSGGAGGSGGSGASGYAIIEIV